MILNEQYEWRDVRYQINRRASYYDPALSFNGRPVKELLPVGSRLYRLDSPVVFGIFAKVWWMKEPAFKRIFERAADASSLRQEWQNSQALSKPAKGKEGKFGGRRGEAATRTQVILIQTTQRVYAWVGIASPLFHRAGGDEQVYLPNLAHGTGHYRSDYARWLRSYTLPTSLPGSLTS